MTRTKKNGGDAQVDHLLLTRMNMTESDARHELGNTITKARILAKALGYAKCADAIEKSIDAHRRRS